MYKILITLFSLVVSLAAYEEDFNSYKDGTSLSGLSSKGILFSSSGEWKVFTTPFSVFNTPVFLEPSNAKKNAPLTVSYSLPQCSTQFDFATDGVDSLDVTAYYQGRSVFHDTFVGMEQGGTYVGTATILMQIDSFVIKTVNQNKLLVDNIKTSNCTLDSYQSSDDLIARYEFEKDLSDSSGNHFDLSSIGTPSYDGGVLKSSISLSSSSLLLPSDFSLGKTKTLSFWFNAITLNEEQTLFDITTDKSSIFTVTLSKSGKLNFYEANSIFSPYYSSVVVKPNQWYHFTMTINTDVPTVYIDGLFDNRFYFFRSPLQIGRSLTIAPKSSHGIPFTGLLDDLRFYSSELSPNEIAEVAHTRTTFNDSFDAGKQFCINNPSQCGLKPAQDPSSLPITTDQKTLQKSSFTFKWYLWQTDEGNVYLTSGSPSNPSVWQMTPKTRQWKPVHNASIFDNFAAQGLNFENVTIAEDGKSISFGPAVENNESK
jgi:hypothetical protein